MAYKYKLSDNDLDEIKLFSNGQKLSSLAKKSLMILSYTFGGIHHLDYNQRKKLRYADEHCFEYVTSDSFATWDSNKLTTLVVLAHELMVRLEIDSHSFRYLKIRFWERTCRKGSTYERHPSIDEVIKYWRKE